MQQCDDTDWTREEVWKPKIPTRFHASPPAAHHKKPGLFNMDLLVSCQGTEQEGWHFSMIVWKCACQQHINLPLCWHAHQIAMHKLHHSSVGHARFKGQSLTIILVARRAVSALGVQFASTNDQVTHPGAST
jgi:hypothetical protein